MTERGHSSLRRIARPHPPRPPAARSSHFIRLLRTRLPEVLIRTASDLLEADPLLQALVLRRLAQDRPDDAALLLEVALSGVQDLSCDALRGRVLATLGPALGPELRPRALALARRIENIAARVVAGGGIALGAPGPVRRALLREFVEILYAAEYLPAADRAWAGRELLRAAQTLTVASTAEEQSWPIAS